MKCIKSVDFYHEGEYAYSDMVPQKSAYINFFGSLALKNGAMLKRYGAEDEHE